MRIHLTNSLIAVFCITLSTNALSQSPSLRELLNQLRKGSPKEAGEMVPLKGGFAVSYDAQLRPFLYFAGWFNRDIAGVTIRCENPQTREVRVIARNAAVRAGQTFVIGPPQNWMWLLGERLLIEAPGFRTCVFQLGEREWRAFTAKVQAYWQLEAERRTQLQQMWLDPLLGSGRDLYPDSTPPPPQVEVSPHGGWSDEKIKRFVPNVDMDD